MSAFTKESILAMANEGRIIEHRRGVVGTAEELQSQQEHDTVSKEKNAMGDDLHKGLPETHKSMTRKKKHFNMAPSQSAGLCVGTSDCISLPEGISTYMHQTAQAVAQSDVSNIKVREKLMAMILADRVIPVISRDEDGGKVKWQGESLERSLKRQRVRDRSYLTCTKDSLKILEQDFNG